MPNKGKGVHLFVGASAVADPFPIRMVRLLGWFEANHAFIFPRSVMGLTEVIAEVKPMVPGAHVPMAHVSTAMPRPHVHRVAYVAIGHVAAQPEFQAQEVLRRR